MKKSQIREAKRFVVLAMVLLQSITVFADIFDYVQEGNLSGVKRELESGVDVNVRNSRGYTPLMYASYSGNLEIVQYLVENGANIEEKNTYGDPPLRLAAYSGQREVFDYLLEQGADINIRGGEDLTILISAVLSRNEDFAKYVSQIEGIKLFAQTEGNNALDYANLLGLEELADYFRNLGFGTTQHKENTIYLTTDNLRLRITEGLNGKQLFTLWNKTPVLVKEIGAVETIDSLKSHWLKIEIPYDCSDTSGNRVQKGTVGWVFGGYVSEIDYKSQQESDLAELRETLEKYDSQYR